MKTRIEAIENLIAKDGNLSDINVNHTFGRAYSHSLEAGNELIDFDDVIWDDDIKEIIENCKRFGITEFTISSGFSSIIETLGEFSELGCKVDGIVKVKSIHKDRQTGENRIVPAIRISL